MSAHRPDPPRAGEIILYANPSGRKRIEVLFENETVWLNQKPLAQLFGWTFVR